RPAIVSSDLHVNPRRKRSLDPNLQNNINQQAHHNKNRQMQQQRHLRRKFMTETVRGMGAPLLLLGGSQAVRWVPPEVRSNRRKALKKHQRRRLALRFRQQRQQTGQQMHPKVHKHLQTPKADLPRPTPPLPPATMMEPPPRRRPPTVRVMGTTQKSTRKAAPPTAIPLRKPWQMLRIAVPPPLRLRVHLRCCCSRLPLPVPLPLGRW
ncbi:uncharacterized protein Tco025E_07558, partial [Trypanosoma conorhini]